MFAENKNSSTANAKDRRPNQGVERNASRRAILKTTTTKSQQKRDSTIVVKDTVARDRCAKRQPNRRRAFASPYDDDDDVIKTANEVPRFEPVVNDARRHDAQIVEMTPRAEISTDVVTIARLVDEIMDDETNDDFLKLLDAVPLQASRSAAANNNCDFFKAKFVFR